MATRQIKDAKDLSTNELIYFKGHAQATYMSDGTTVEDAINNISVSGGDGSSSSTYTWAWYGEDSGTLADGEFEKIRDAEFLYIYMPQVGITALSTVKIKSEEMLLYVVHGIEVNEPVLSNMGFMFAPSGAFELERISYDVVTPDTLSTVATSGDYNDLSNKPTIPTESTVSGWGFTKNAGTVTGIKLNGSQITPSTAGVVELGYIHKQLMTSTSTSMSLSPNKYYRNTSTSLSSLTILLSSVSNSNIINEYFVEFTTSSSGTTVSFPSTIKWANGTAPTFEAGCTYQVSIVNNLGTYIKFA